MGAAVLLAGFALTGMAMSAVAAAPIGESEARLILAVPELENTAPSRSREPGEGYVEEISIWRNPNFPVAVFSVIELGMNRLFIAQNFPKFSDQIEGAHKGHEIEFMNKGERDNVLGTAEYWRYKVKSVNFAFECVGIREFFGSPGDFDIVRGYDANADVLGTKVIVGRYCVRPGDVVDRETIETVISGLGFKGYGDPSDLVGAAGLGTETEPPPFPPTVSTGGDFEDFTCDDPIVASRPVCQEWRKKLEAWKERQ
jgi:hypothetical protein